MWLAANLNLALSPVKVGLMQRDQNRPIATPPAPMKPLSTLLTGLFVLLPCLAQAQNGAAPSAVAASAAPAVPTYSRHKTSDFCTTAPRSEWIAEEEMKLLAQHRGYRIKTFKISKTNCYEIYGFDHKGQIVEAYFNPITTRLARQNIAQ